MSGEEGVEKQGPTIPGRFGKFQKRSRNAQQSSTPITGWEDINTLTFLMSNAQTTSLLCKREGGVSSLLFLLFGPFRFIAAFRLACLSFPRLSHASSRSLANASFYPVRASFLSRPPFPFPPPLFWLAQCVHQNAMPHHNKDDYSW